MIVTTRVVRAIKALAISLVFITFFVGVHSISDSNQLELRKKDI